MLMATIIIHNEKQTTASQFDHLSLNLTSKLIFNNNNEKGLTANLYLSTYSP